MPREGRPSWELLVLAILIVVIVWISAPVWIWNQFNTLQDRAYFGGMYGAVEALFSGLAFAGVIYALFLQRHELALQREELRASRKAFIAQNEILTEQLRTTRAAHRSEERAREAASMPILKGGTSNAFGGGQCQFELLNAGARVVLHRIDGLADERWRLSSTKLESNGSATVHCWATEANATLVASIFFETGLARHYSQTILGRPGGTLIMLGEPYRVPQALVKDDR
jgi:hypothetical protein